MIAWNLRTHGILSAFILAALLGTAPLPAVAQVVHAFDLSEPDPASAIRAFGVQAQIQILASADDLKGKRFNPVSGDITTEAALNDLLAGTGLYHRYVGERAVALVSNNSEGGASAQPSREPARGAPVIKDDPVERVPTARAADAPSSASEQSVKGRANPAEKNSNLEEIVVTAEKREEHLIDVPISMVVLSADELKKRNITNLDELRFAVPGLVIQDSGNLRQIVLRGVANSFGSASLIGLYVDEADVTSQVQSQPDLNTYDLERVEVLRGPQGTLYGDGSVGGTVRFVTNSPALDKFVMESNVAALFTQDGAPSQHINAVVNVPLINNELGLRIAGTFYHDGG